jgi:hypothetical protein
VKLALVTTPWNAPSPVGAVTQALVRHLADTIAIDVYVEKGREGADYFGWSARAADTLHPRDYDQVLFAAGDEAQHGFMAPMVRELGGCVALHDWRLLALATAAYPELARGGWSGTWRAAREGGLRQARAYRAVSETGAWSDVVAGGAADGKLSLHRSLVRFGDSFLVHGESMRRRILSDRNAPTPIGVVPYGSDAWARSEARREERTALGLPAPRKGALVVTTLIDAAPVRPALVLRAGTLARSKVWNCTGSRSARLRLVRMRRPAWSKVGCITRAQAQRKKPNAGSEPAISRCSRAGDLSARRSTPSRQCWAAAAR